MFESTRSQAKKSSPDELTITEVARKSGVRATAIRYYESIKVLPEPRRTNGRRRYNPAILDRLAFINVAQRLGFSLTEISILFGQRGSTVPLAKRWQVMARGKLADVEQLIRDANEVRLSLINGLRCDCPDLHDCIACVLKQCTEHD